MSGPGDIDALRGANGIIRRMTAEAQQGRRFADGGPDWERLRFHACRYFVLQPIFHGARACLSGLVAVIGRRRARQSET